MADTDEADFQGPSVWIRTRNAALEYVGIGWFLTQVVGVLGRELGWPSEVGDYMVIALGLGFVGTIVVAFVMAKRSPGQVRKRGLAVAVLGAVAALMVWYAGHGLGTARGGPSGMVQESRGLFSTSSEVDAFFVVHPQEPLLHTGIFVRPGQRLSAWGQGRVNLALTRLVQAVDADSIAYDWVGPAGEVGADGFPIIRRDRGLAGRERCLIHRAFPYGALLAVVAPGERLLPGSVRELTPDEEVFLVGDHLETIAQVGGYVTLAVNDVYVDRQECDPEGFAEGREPSRFFRDNLGFFTARLTVR